MVSFTDRTMAVSYFTDVIQSYDLGVKRAVQYLLQKSPGTLTFLKIIQQKLNGEDVSFSQYVLQPQIVIRET